MLDGCDRVPGRAPTFAREARLDEHPPCKREVACSNHVAGSERVSFRGRTSGFQPEDEGSIPSTRTTSRSIQPMALGCNPS